MSSAALEDTRAAPGARNKKARSRPFWRSLSTRLFFIALVWIALFLIGGSVIFSQLFSGYLTDALDDRLEQYVEALIGTAQISPEGQISFERSLGEQRFVVPYSGYYWQVGTAEQMPLRSRSLWDQVLEVDYSSDRSNVSMSMRPGPDEQSLRVLERDVFLPGAAMPYRFVVTGNLDEVRQQLARFHQTLFWSMALLGLGLIAVVSIQITYGLRPLRRLRHAVIDIRSAKAQRIPDDLPPEVMPLVGEMNALLDQNEKAVGQAKTQAGNLAHALKTPLSILTNEAHSTQSGLSDTVEKQVSLMRRHIDHNLARARAATHYGRGYASANPGAAAQAIVRVVSKLYRERSITYHSDLDAAVKVISGQQDLEEILGNVIENAAKFSRSTVRVTLTRGAEPSGEAVKVVIEDDGPGIPQSQRESIFARGKRLDESVPGTGLGLSIVTDLLDAHGGAIALDSSADLGGLKAIIRLKTA